MTPPTTEDLDRWEALAREASDEPWEAGSGDYNSFVEQAPDGITLFRPGVNNFNAAEDAAFIAAAREAVPVLCEEVRRLRHENAVLFDKGQAGKQSEVMSERKRQSAETREQLTNAAMGAVLQAKDDALAERDALRAALAELVECKRLKEAGGPAEMRVYRARRDAAWTEARRLLG